MQVAENFVAPPTSDDFVDVNVDPAKGECHGSAGPETAGGNFCVFEADFRTNFHDIRVNCFCDFVALEGEPVLSVFVGAKQCFAGGRGGVEDKPLGVDIFELDTRLCGRLLSV